MSFPSPSNAITIVNSQASFVESLSKLLKSTREIFTPTEIRAKLGLKKESWSKKILLAKRDGSAIKHGIASAGRKRGVFYYHTDYPELASKKSSDSKFKSGEFFKPGRMLHQQSLLAEEVPHLKTNLEIKSTEDLRKIRRQARDVCLQAHEILLRRDRELMENLF